MQKTNLAEAFPSFDDTWSPKAAGAVNDMAVRLAELDGEFAIVVEPGEFLIVPRGTDHCPVAEPDCQVLLLEPATTGNVRDERTVADLGRIGRS